MSEENVEIVRRIYEAAGRRDAGEVLDLYHPEIEWDISRHPYGGMSGEKLYRGHAGLRAWFRDWYEAFENFEHDQEDLIDGGDCVVSVGTDRATGRGSGAKVEWKGIVGVWTFKNGRVIRVVWFPTREEALKAVGLSE